MNPEPPRDRYKQHKEAIEKVYRTRFTEEPGCDCDPPCEGNEHQEKVDAAEQAHNDFIYEQEREKRAFNE